MLDEYLAALRLFFRAIEFNLAGVAKISTLGEKGPDCRAFTTSFWVIVVTCTFAESASHLGKFFPGARAGDIRSWSRVSLFV